MYICAYVHLVVKSDYQTYNLLLLNPHTLLTSSTTSPLINVVGISMGGIIVTNAIARGVLTGLVDGAVSVSGTDICI